jgi:hypothetical protein
LAEWESLFMRQTFIICCFPQSSAGWESIHVADFYYLLVSPRARQGGNLCSWGRLLLFVVSPRARDEWQQNPPNLPHVTNRGTVHIAALVRGLLSGRCFCNIILLNIYTV